MKYDFDEHDLMILMNQMRLFYQDSTKEELLDMLASNMIFCQMNGLGYEEFIKFSDRLSEIATKDKQLH